MGVFMKKIIKFLEKYFVPFAGKIGSQRHLVAIRDGFVSVAPLIIVGSLAKLINNLPYQTYQNFMDYIFGESWTVFTNNIYNATFAVISILIVFTISSSLAQSYKENSMTASLISFIALLALIQTGNQSLEIPMQWLDSTGLFVAIIVAIVATEIFVRLMKNKRLIIHMPDGVPPALAKSFAALIPTLIILVLFTIIKLLAMKFGIVNINEALYNLLQAPLASMANNLGSAIIIVFLMHIFWFFGLHGSNILEPVIQAMYLPALQENIVAMAEGQVAPNIITKSFYDAFVYMGGAGTTISLILAIFLVSKREDYRELGKLSIPMGIFNINEPVLFGLPIVMNPILFFPFILTPIVLTVTSYFAIVLKIVPPTVAMVTWSTPPLISGFLVTGSIMGSLLQLINMIIAVFIYIPFVVVADRATYGQIKHETRVKKGEINSGI